MVSFFRLRAIAPLRILEVQGSSSTYKLLSRELELLLNYPELRAKAPYQTPTYIELKLLTPNFVARAKA